MGRIIHTTNPTRQRKKVLRKMAADIKTFSKSPLTDGHITDLAADLVISLQEIRDSVDRTAQAWEKRNYWLKADSFRRQWSWVDRFLVDLSNTPLKANPADTQQTIRNLKNKLDTLAMQ